MISNARKKRRAGRLYIFLLALLLITAVIFAVIFGNISCKGVESIAARSYYSKMPDSKLISVPYVAQNPDFPTGCEAVSAVMLLNFHGYDITAEDFVDNYLDKSVEFYAADGRLYGPDPNEVYVGNPRELSGYGCYEPVIEKAVKKYLGCGEQVCNTCGKSLEYLCDNYISSGIPALVWASINMSETYPSDEWRLENGDTFTWISGEHCLVLVGYDSENYYFNDPIAGEAVGYDREVAEARYAELGMQSMVIKG